jgi:hypothetical protein
MLLCANLGKIYTWHLEKVPLAQKTYGSHALADIGHYRLRFYQAGMLQVKIKLTIFPFTTK